MVISVGGQTDQDHPGFDHLTPACPSSGWVSEAPTIRQPSRDAWSEWGGSDTIRHKMQAGKWQMLRKPLSHIRNMRLRPSQNWRTITFDRTPQWNTEEHARPIHEYYLSDRCMFRNGTLTANRLALLWGPHIQWQGR